MNEKMISTRIAHGVIHYPDHSERMSDISWVKHPTFKGVYLKHMIQGTNTDGRFSSHLVKIHPQGCLENHAHENQLELHEVLEGDGVCQLHNEVFDYHVGKMAVIPKGKIHSVQAGDHGLILLAKFFPALV